MIGDVQLLDGDVRVRLGQRLEIQWRRAASRAVAMIFQSRAEYWRTSSRPMPRLAPVMRMVGFGASAARLGGQAGGGQQAGNDKNDGAHGSETPGRRWARSFGDGAGTVKVYGRAPRQVVAPRSGCYSMSVGQALRDRA